jgi:2-polyprenyl-3-methyl-5-hydroxy-6-metoxy-1,4-benzoquinol methylase
VTDFENKSNKEKLNEIVSERRERLGWVSLPPDYAHFLEENMLQFLFRLSRYKFVVKMLSKEDDVLEVGCGSGLGSIFIGQHCNSVTGIDEDIYEIEAAERLNRRRNTSFLCRNFFDYMPDQKYGAIVSLDVIEHLPEEEGERMVGRSAEMLKDHGLFIVGTPSIYCAPYQSPASQAGHVKMYDQQELVELVKKYFKRTLAFSMNDEMVHTGFSKMAWYYFVLGTGLK